MCLCGSWTMDRVNYLIFIFFCNDPATTEIYTLSLHDALPIPPRSPASTAPATSSTSRISPERSCAPCWTPRRDRKSTRLNSSHANISYAVFCLKKKKKNNKNINQKKTKKKTVKH